MTTRAQRVLVRFHCASAAEDQMSWRKNVVWHMWGLRGQRRVLFLIMPTPVCSLDGPATTGQRVSSMRISSDLLTYQGLARPITPALRLLIAMEAERPLERHGACHKPQGAKDKQHQVLSHHQASPLAIAAVLALKKASLGPLATLPFTEVGWRNRAWSIW